MDARFQNKVSMLAQELALVGDGSPLLEHSGPRRLQKHCRDTRETQGDKIPVLTNHKVQSIYQLSAADFVQPAGKSAEMPVLNRVPT